MNELNFLDSLFNEVMGCATPTTPRVDVIEDDGNYTFEMELPGRSEKDVNIELDRDNLTIASKTEKEEVEETKKDSVCKTKYLLKERNTCDFKRCFTLPDDVDKESICANFKNGVLTISMNKKAVTAPKKIAIEAC